MMTTKKDEAYASITDLGTTIAPLWYGHLQDIGVSARQSEILLLLETNDISIGRLSQELGVTSSAVTQAVESLVTKELVLRKQQQSDRRIVSIELSSKGKQITCILRDKRRQLIDTLLDDLTDAELSQLIALQNKMMDSIKE